MIDTPHITILGGGPAGLAAAWYAHQAAIEFDVFEASSTIGGNCRTIRFGDFLVDTGAHRLHDRDDDMIAIARRLLGDDLLRVEAPSQMLHNGTLLDFPLAPLNLARGLPLRTVAAIARENIALRLRRSHPAKNFGAIARSLYGKTLASLALLNYSEKLWGCDPDELMPEVAGARLARLDLRSFVMEAFGSRSTTRRHLDGAFYYPRLGIGQFFERIGEQFTDRIHLSSRIARIDHDGGSIVAVHTSDGRRRDIATVINTLPIGMTVDLLSPRAPDHVVTAARSLRFRHLRLCILIVARERISHNASIYFPDSSVPFTRLYESKNRSIAMAPASQTALVLEVPCDSNDRLSRLG
ncbi:MAG: FAD-dependent oxidoreductase, partial [bacterium]|nr:FAD-dependent oxidoreductase [Candidatus Kapabacteria bacterium]